MEVDADLLAIWRAQWRVTCTAGGMTQDEASAWIRKHEDMIMTRGVTNRQKNALALKDCTGLAYYDDSNIPFGAVIRKDADDFRDPSGLKIFKPKFYADKTLDEILNLYDRYGLQQLTIAPSVA